MAMLDRLRSIGLDIGLIYGVAAVASAAAVALAVVHVTKMPPKVVVSSVRVADGTPQDIAPTTDDDNTAFAHPVRTIPISRVEVPAVTAPIVITQPTMIAEQAVRDRIAKPIRSPRTGHLTIQGDICARHGGYRVDEPSKRKWHCVFPKRSEVIGSRSRSAG